MKNLKTLSTSLLAAIVLFASCKKETEETESNTPSPSPSGPSAAQLRTFFQDNREDMEQTFTIDASSPTLITGNQGTTIQFYPNSFETQSGVSVTGNVEVTLVEIYSKGDVVLANTPTMGNTFGGGIEPLITGGEFFVEVTQNGVALDLKPGVIYTMSALPPGGTDPQMTLFYGDESRGNDTLVWDLADSARFLTSGNEYNFFPDSLNWINCDYFYFNPNPKTNLSAVIPAGYTNATCKVFVSFDGLNSMTSFFSYNAGVYSTFSPYQLPVGLDVHLIAISVINGVTHASITPASITTNIQVSINPLVATTQAQLRTDINNLP